MLAELSARECGHLSLDEALRLTALVALHDRDRAASGTRDGGSPATWPNGRRRPSTT